MDNFFNCVQVLVRYLLEASALVLTMQQMKEILQEVRRLENFASLVACVKEHEEKGKEFKADALKVSCNFCSFVYFMLHCRCWLRWRSSSVTFGNRLLESWRRNGKS